MHSCAYPSPRCAADGSGFHCALVPRGTPIWSAYHRPLVRSRTNGEVPEGRIGGLAHTQGWLMGGGVVCRWAVAGRWHALLGTPKWFHLMGRFRCTGHAAWFLIASEPTEMPVLCELCTNGCPLTANAHGPRGSAAPPAPHAPICTHYASYMCPLCAPHVPATLLEPTICPLCPPMPPTHVPR